MRRADRLFAIVVELRRRGVTTAADLAAHLGVSERTIYRDVADLGASGVPIDGAAGVGYRLGRNFDLPPLMFTLGEVQALVLGVRMVESYADDDLSAAARAALSKIEAALPATARHQVAETALYAPSTGAAPDVGVHLPRVREAIDGRRRLRIDYADVEGSQTQRVVRPLGLFFWGRHWTVGGWCELREAHRSFRIDRIVGATVLDEVFERVSPVTLEDYVAHATGRFAP